MAPPTRQPRSAGHRSTPRDLVAGERAGGRHVQRGQVAEQRDARRARRTVDARACDSPRPSAPSTRQIGPSTGRSRSNSDRSPAPSRPSTGTPWSRSCSSALGRPPTTDIGRCSMAPAAALVTVGVTWVARWRGRITPVTPAHSAERSSAPRLPGSVTPSRRDEEGHHVARWARSGRRGRAPASGAAARSLLGETRCARRRRAACG